MYSDDEQVGFGSGGGGQRRSPSPDDRGRGSTRRDRSRSRSRGRDRDLGGDRDGGDRHGDLLRELERGDRDARNAPKGGGKGDGKGKRGPRTTGREMPKLYSIHKASVVSIRDYGAFVRLGDGGTYKDGLLHISRISASGRIEAVTDVLEQDESVWVKVVQVDEDAQKHSLDMRFVEQRSGKDLDPENEKADQGGKGGGKGGPEPIRIGAVQATTCSRCGARGHAARECFAGSGKNYELLEAGNEDEEVGQGAEKPEFSVPGVDPKTVKAALKAYMSKKATGAGSDSDAGDKKQKKKQKKEEKKEKKREKKEAKKEKKKLKKESKKEKTAPGKEEKGGKEKEEDKKEKDKKKKDKKKKKKGKKGGGGAEEGSIAALLADVSTSSSSSSSS